MSRQRGNQANRRPGSSQASSRRERELRERRNERLILYGAGAVFAVVVVIVAIGLYVTQYRPPRAHVLTVGDRDYNAGQVERRTIFEGNLGRASSVQDVVDIIVDMEVVLQRAPEFVGEVTDDDVEAELRERLGFQETAGDENDAYPDALATLLRSVALNRDEYDRVVSAEILLNRLGEPVREEIGEAGVQIDLSVIRVADRGVADETRQLVLDGGDFAELARERSRTASAAEDGGEVGWFPPGMLSDEIRDSFSDLEAGSISDVVEAGGFFSLYYISERDEDREYEPEQIDALVSNAQREWIDEQREFVDVEIDLSPGEEDWILKEAAKG